MKKIVLVEDDAAIRDVFDLAFRTYGYEFINLDNGDAIIESTLGPPDLFILDKQLSGIDGLDICRFIRRNETYQQIPVIMLSASPNITAQAKQAGANDAIVKPFSLKAIREIIERYLEGVK